MKMRSIGLVVCAVMSACAQAGSFVGRWVGMTKGDVLTITRTGVDSYLGETQQSFPLYLTKDGSKLVGNVLHNARWKVTIQFDGDGDHLLAKMPGFTQEYRRASR
jgi:hypothetical protein